MTRLQLAFLATAAAAALGSSACSQSGVTSCLSDADCSAGDICNRGKCFAPVQRGSGGSSQTGSAGVSGGSSNGGASTSGAATSAASTTTSGGSTTASVGGSSGSAGGSGGSSGASTGQGQGGSSGGASGVASGSSGGASGSSGGASGGGSSSGGSASSGGSSGAPVTCSAPVTNYLQNGGACGTERWAVKTGTDSDVGNIDMVPQVATIAQLVALTRNQGGNCTRNPPTETTVFEIQDVNLTFHSLESDSDYHIVATDNSGNSMIIEVPYPPCVGDNSCGTAMPLLCEITHARAAVDSFKPSSNDTPMGVGTVIGVGFFDYAHGQVGVAPNVIELHPVLAICLGQGCDPLAGY